MILQYRRGLMWYNHPERITDENKAFYINSIYCDEYKLISYKYLSPNDTIKTEIVHEHKIFNEL